jgi:hypothetical protein
MALAENGVEHKQIASVGNLDVVFVADASAPHLDEIDRDERKFNVGDPAIGKGTASVVLDPCAQVYQPLFHILWQSLILRNLLPQY